jgi:hypothetical protein
VHHHFHQSLSQSQKWMLIAMLPLQTFLVVIGELDERFLPLQPEVDPYGSFYAFHGIVCIPS